MDTVADAEVFEMMINGKQKKAGHYDSVRNPADLSTIGFAPRGDAEALDEAVAAARAAFADWSGRPEAERQEACRAIANIIAENQAELARLVTLETGKPLKGLGAEFEIGGCIGWSQATAEFSLPPTILQDDENARIELRHVPVGVVGSITPWNWPLLIAVWHILPAIRTGNTVVIKPSPYSPLGTLRLVELMNEVLPAGVVNVVSGGNELGALISSHSDIDKIVFTGSTATGEKIMQAAAPGMKRLTLELGGNDAGIVLPDADPSVVAEGIFWGAFINAGQTCAALKRLYVHSSIYDDVCDALVAYASQVPMGNGLIETNALGPLQNQNQFEKVKDLVEDAKRSGARVLTGGSPLGSGYFYPVTLLADAKDGMRVVDQEQFGPVLPIICYDEISEAIESANHLPFGLCASVWGSDKDALAAVADKLVAGTVYVNKHADIAPHVPFGGVKSSGLGVEFGIDGLKAYTNIKVINCAA
ncbi:aldehyde dehydrogenase family protein [Hyphomonas sp.]|uniref:aldehyde dehydrogenase family protein n=1 Tax=Hyphomonas sp. TaxID=87 RepID=UPI0025BDE415|nr:aldehyde dehydrogenase family protein [Hyphomonas sp.]